MVQADRSDRDRVGRLPLHLGVRQRPRDSTVAGGALQQPGDRAVSRGTLQHVES